MWRAIFKEAAYRKLNFLLSLLGVAAAVTLFVFFFTAGEASRAETTRLMRDIGLNLRIIPKDTNMDRFWSTDIPDLTMPEAYVHTLAAHTGLSYSHLVATLRRKTTWRDMEIIITGLLPEICPHKKMPMSPTLERSTARIGFEVARTLNLKQGDEVDLLGKAARITAVLAESGTSDDIQIQVHLYDAQEILGLEGRINEIKALDCVCFSEDDALATLRRQLEPVLPDAKVLQEKAIARARFDTRLMIEKYLAFLWPFLLVVCSGWIGLLSLLNVRERRQEIGIFRALGYGSGDIAGLFLGKAIMIGLAGALAGFATGTALALRVGPQIFRMTAHRIQPDYSLLGWSVVSAVVFTVLCSLIPAMVAVAQDPAVTLRET
ncbi:MAG: FtsX-like permease family protein [Phycisphaerales bacterium]|nr:FtsX-like permease family protein [Phycisphaerales bacterium]